MRLPAESILVVIVGLTGGTVLALGGLLTIIANRTTADVGQVAHTCEVQAELASLLATIADADTGLRGYVLTSDPAYLAPYHGVDVRVQNHLDRLRELTADNPAQQTRINRLEKEVADGLAVMAEILARHDGQQVTAGASLNRIEQDRRELNDVRQWIGEMGKEEAGLLTARKRTAEASGQRVGWVVVILVVGAVLQMFAGLILIRRDLAARRHATARLHEQATRDPLTGLCNRREFDARLRIETTRSRHERRPLAAVLIDLDHFKSVNDTHGHTVGDAVLRMAAARLSAAIRDVDLVARYGGEEFVLLLPGIGPTEAKAAAERVRESIANDPLTGQTDDGRPLTLLVTASFGVACLDLHRDSSPEELLKQCDQALYQAKRAGRNRVTLFDSGGDTVQSRRTARIAQPPARTPNC